MRALASTLTPRLKTKGSAGRSLLQSDRLFYASLFLCFLLCLAFYRG